MQSGVLLVAGFAWAHFAAVSCARAVNISNVKLPQLVYMMQLLLQLLHPLLH